MGKTSEVSGEGEASPFMGKVRNPQSASTYRGTEMEVISLQLF